MMRYLVALGALVVLGCARSESDAPGGERAVRLSQAPSSPAGEGSRHTLHRPDQMQWKDGPPSLPAGAKFVLLEGDPAKAGFFAMRVKVPDGYRIPPHTHPAVERVTVVSGTFHLGMGETADWGKMEAMPAGSYVSMPPGMKHYASASGETVVQLATEGPWGITYLNPADDPRKKAK